MSDEKNGSPALPTAGADESGRGADSRVIHRAGRITRDGRTASRDVVRLTIYLDPQVAQALNETAFRKGQQKSQIVEEAVRAYLGVQSDGDSTPPDEA